MKVYRYKSYSAYKAAQVKANKAKLALSWVRPETVDLICKRILAVNPSPTFGLCHGTRRGEEQKLFKDRLGCPVIGTEISPTAKKFADTVNMDFHRVKPEWIGAADFVYSNSLDHARTPLLALTAWQTCLKPEGLLVIEWVERLAKDRPKRSTSTDPFSATTAEVCDLIRETGGQPLEVLPLSYSKPKMDDRFDTKVTIIFSRRAS